MAISEAAMDDMSHSHRHEKNLVASIVACSTRLFLTACISSLFSFSLSQAFAGIRFIATILFKSILVAFNDRDKDEFARSFLVVIGTSVFCILLTGGVVLYCRVFHPPQSLELSLSRQKPDDVTDSLQLLNSYRKSLQKISIIAMENYEEKELFPLFEQLAQLPNLISFTADLRLPVNLLIHLLDHSQSLRELSLCFQLSGTHNEFATLGKSMEANSTLTEVSMECCDDESSTNHLDWDPVIQSLANLPTLQNLAICYVPASPTSFTKLLQSTHLHTLFLTSISHLTCEQIEQLADEHPFGALQSLTVPLHPGTEMAWASVLGRTITLAYLTLTIEEYTVPRDNKHADFMDPFLPIARAIAVNSSLRSLELNVNENLLNTSYDNTAVGLNSKTLSEMSAALKKNTELKELRIGCCQANLTIDSPVLGGLVQTLRQNYTLERIELFTTSSKRLVIPEIEFYTKCNRMGRGQLFQGTLGDHHVADEFFRRHRSDLSAIFHVLTERPELLLRGFAQ